MRAGAALRQPVLYLSAYGGRWASDVLTGLHNAVRRELLDMYACTASMQERGLNLTLAEVDEFAAWWALFRAFVADYFIDNIFTVFRATPSGEVLPLLFRTLDQFSPRLIAYFARAERILPKLIGRAHTPAAAAAVSVATVDWIREEGASGWDGVVMCGRWMEARPLAAAWAAAHIRWGHRLGYARAKRRFEAGHAAIAEGFHQRLWGP
ncbi:hypothetical protein I4F81_009610 [Pyropia yezoensis]|uniref:Uncharacterized protein n=1 Tax=Pyropia yezoensis TaxID=2788 RepID=A0ACC3CAU3_PYRYE|nr:hypothetical protein I4F81_009610 [Neopyropia yezoensis]